MRSGASEMNDQSGGRGRTRGPRGMTAATRRAQARKAQLQRQAALENLEARTLLTDLGALDVAVGVDTRALADLDAFAEEDVRLDDDVGSDLGVVREEDARGIDQRDARRHRGLARAPLKCSLRRGELGARIHAERVGFLAGHEMRRKARRAAQRDDVGEIVFLLGVVVAHHRQQLKQNARVGADDAGSATVADDDASDVRSRFDPAAVRFDRGNERVREAAGTADAMVYRACRICSSFPPNFNRFYSIRGAA